jgi:hypothetical protein
MKATTLATTLLGLVTLLSVTASHAWATGQKAEKPRIAVASVTIQGVTHTAKVKLDARGRIVPWSATKWASITPGQGKSIFFWLGEHREESGIEWQRGGKARNGYGLVTVGTTADSVTLGVSLKEKKGFFNYRDLGSGNGHSTHVLTVEESKR